MSNTNFDKIAKAYDILTPPEARLAKEGPFLLDFAGQAKHVLDLACGTGAHACFMAEKTKADIIGCDLSQDMIDYAKVHRSHSRLSYVQADMCSPGLHEDATFELVYCFGNSINLLPNLSSVDKMLFSCKGLLHDKGVLLIHCVNPKANIFKSEQVVERVGEIDGQQFSIKKTLLHFEEGARLSIEMKDERGDVFYQGQNEMLGLSWEVLYSLLNTVGFSTIQVYGGMDKSPFDENKSSNFIAVIQA